MKSKKITLWLGICIVVLLGQIALLESLSPEIPGWYGVSSWELEVCSKWGGTPQAEHGAEVSAEQFLSRLTIAVQGEDTRYPDDSHLYVVSYYIEPLSDIEFYVKLISSETDEEYFIVESGSAGYNNPASGFESIESDDVFTHVEFGYRYPDRDVQTIVVPLVVKQSS